MSFFKQILYPLAIILFLPTVAYTADGASKEKAQMFINEFYKHELEGDRDFRVSHSKWGQAALRKIRKYNDMEMGYFNILNDPLWIVSGFEVKDVKLTGNHGTATVVFHVIARSTAFGERRVLAFNKEDFTEQVGWEYASGQYYIMNPIVPKVSVEAAIKEYQESYSGMYTTDEKGVKYTFPSDWPGDSPASRFAKKNIGDLVHLNAWLKQNPTK